MAVPQVTPSTFVDRQVAAASRFGAGAATPPPPWRSRLALIAIVGAAVALILPHAALF